MKKLCFFHVGVFCLTIFVFSSSQLLFSQSDDTKKAKNKEQKVGQKEYLPKPKGMANQSTLASPSNTSSTSSFLKSFVILIIFLIAVYLVFKWIQKKKSSFSPTQGDDSVIHVLKTTPITPNKSIQLVEIGNKLYILGLGDQMISLINTVDKPEEIEEIKSQCLNNLDEPQSRSFKSILNSYFPFTNQKSKSRVDKTVHFLNDQRDKLKELKRTFKQ